MPLEILLGDKKLSATATHLVFDGQTIVRADEIAEIDNTSDADKPVSTLQQAALDLKINISDIKDNLTSSDTDKPLSAAQGQALKTLIDALSSDLSPQGNWDATTAAPSPQVVGNFWIVSVDGTTDLGGIDEWKAGDWVIFTATGWAKADHTNAVFSIEGHVGTVTLADLGLDNVDNTSDADKPVSTAQQTALDLKADALSMLHIVGDKETATGTFNTLVYTVPTGKLLAIDNISIIGVDVGTVTTAFGGKIVTDTPYDIVPQQFFDVDGPYKNANFDVSGIRVFPAGTQITFIGNLGGAVSAGNYFVRLVLRGWLITDS